MNIAWIVFIFAVLMLLEIKYYDIMALKRVSYRRYFSRNAVFEGEKLQMVEVIQNGKLTPIPWLRVESRISSNLRFKAQENLEIEMDLFHRSLFFLRGFRRVTRRHEITCMRRGYYTLKQTSVTAGDLFGIVSNSKDFPADSELLVYPSLPALEDLPDEAISFQGDVSARRWIMPDPILVNGIREYREGDSIRDVHWSATARTGELSIKSRDFTVTPKVMVILNAQSSETLWGPMSEDEKKVIEQGIRISAGLVSWALENGLESGFASNCCCVGRNDETIYIPPAASDGQFQDILETMARILIVRQMSFHTFLDTFIAEHITGLDIALVSTYSSDDIEYRIELLRSMGNRVYFIGIPGGGLGVVS